MVVGQLTDGCRIVVSAGRTSAAIGMSSKPVMARSAGTRKPRPSAPIIRPSAVSSFAQTTASGVAARQELLGGDHAVGLLQPDADRLGRRRAAGLAVGGEERLPAGADVG